MKNQLLLIFSFLILPFQQYGQSQGDAIASGDRLQITSKILNEERSFQVYLPPSYYFSKKNDYPVIYVMDGDYNFHYDTGLIELLSAVSEKIPEMIVVGIADKGSESYRNNCYPTNTSEKSGNAANFRKFIEEELKPYINETYRASNYDILIGHSVGGLFVSDYFLEQPHSFGAFIAIDPALWYNDYEIIDRADETFSTWKDLDEDFYISLSQLKGMGVRQFVGKLAKYFPEKQHWNYFKYDDENHNSVGLVTIKDALEDLFREWEIEKAKFMSFQNAQALLDHFRELKTQFNSSFLLPPGLIANVTYYYREDPEQMDILEEGIEQDFPASLDEFYTQKALIKLEGDELKVAEKILKDNLELHPDSFKSYQGLSKVYIAKNDPKTASEMSKKALKLAKEEHARQWQINQLQAEVDKTRSMAK